MQIKWDAILAAKKSRARTKQVDLEMQNELEKRRNDKIENSNRRIVLKVTNEALKLAKGNFDQINKELIGKLKEYIQPEEKVSVGRGNLVEITNTKKNLVLSLSAQGVSQPEIAMTLGMTKPTLTKHFRKELDLGGELDSAFLGSFFRVIGLSGGADPRHNAALALLITNKTDIVPKGSIDHTNLDGSLQNIVFLESNGRDTHVSREEIMAELRKHDVENGDVVDADFVDVDENSQPIANGEENSQ